MERSQAHALDTRNQDYLKAHPGFQGMPSRMQGWILHSPHASEDFAIFFQRDGFIEPKADVSLPYYHATEPPRIVVSKKDYDALHGPQAKSAIELELSMFTTLAHEIGHDEFNPGARPFGGQGEQEYVAYRAKLEASAIFNAFPIFSELKGAW